MTITKRLIILVAVPLLILIGLGVVTLLQLAEIEIRTRYVAEVQVGSLTALGNITGTLADLRISVRSYLLSGDKAEQGKFQAEFSANKMVFTQQLSQYTDTLVSDAADRRLLDEYRDLSGQWIAGAEKVMSVAGEGRRDEAVTLLLGPLGELGARLAKVSSEWIQHNDELGMNAGRAAIESIDGMRRKLFAAVSIALAVTGILGWLTFRAIVNPIHALQTSVESIAGGDYAKEVPFINAVDETGMLARSIEVLKQGASAMSEQRWIKTQSAQLSSELQGARTYDEFGQRLVSGLVPMLGGGVAAFYNFVGNLKRIERIASYGLAEGGSAHTFQMGEGLAGQCARERKQVMLGDLPPDYLRVSSGLGGAAPIQAVAWPLMAQDALLAVVEFASFREIRPGEQALVAELLPIAGMTLEILQRNMETRELLEHSQEQAGKLQRHTDELLVQQESLRASEEQFRTLLEAAPDAMIISDEGGRIQLVNAQAEKLFGYRSDEMLGKPVEMLVPERLRSTHPAHRQRFYAHPSVRSMGGELALFALRKDGTEFAVEISLSPLPDVRGRGRLVCSSLRDITERKQAQIELQTAKDAAEAATKAKSDFLANMSHEIRTPMNAIIGLSHLALKTDLSAKQRDYVSKVHNAGTSLLGIINDILDFSKIEAGKLDIETTDFSLDEVIASVTTLTAQKAHDKGLEFLVEVAEGVPTALLGDPLRLSQIITNLVNNAVKFTEQGEIRVKAELLERTGDKIKLRFSVQDTGMGMNKAQAARLFQPFMQADTSTTRKHGGTGLGLTICRRLVEMMGGQIWLESEPGAGSTFLFTVWMGLGSSHGKSRMVPEGLRDLRVLVVDDNSAAREVLADALQGVAKRVDVVSSGAEAVAAVKQNDAVDPYGVVFMDWRMPGMAGTQALRLIKQDPQLVHRPAVIMVTAFGRDEVREEAEKALVDGFLVKPVTRSMLVDSLVTLFAVAGDRSGPVLTKADEHGGRIAGVRILLAEDNEINQQIAVELLEGAGAQVQVANNGQEAVEKVAEATYDVVLMDLQMPVMDGYQAIAKIRSDQRFDKVPIIAMTAHATVEERQRCLDAGMADHISKPIDPVTMFATIAKYCGPAFKRTVEPAEAPPAVKDADVLIDLPGIDTVLGQTHMAGNRKLYLKLLRDFHRNYAGAVRTIREAIDGHRNEEALRLTHTLKGLSGSLGAMDLYAAAEEVETALKASDPGKAMACLPRVDQRLQIVISGLAALEEAPATKVVPADGPSAEVDHEALGTAMKVLAELLRKNNPEAEAALETVTALCVGQWAGRIQRLGLALDRFDFKAAIKALEELAGDAEVTL